MRIHLAKAFDIYSLYLCFNVYLLYVAHVSYIIKRIMVWYGMVRKVYFSLSMPHIGLWSSNHSLTAARNRLWVVAPSMKVEFRDERLKPKVNQPIEFINFCNTGHLVLL